MLRAAFVCAREWPMGFWLRFSLQRRTHRPNTHTRTHEQPEVNRAISWEEGLHLLCVHVWKWEGNRETAKRKALQARERDTAFPCASAAILPQLMPLPALLLPLLKTGAFPRGAALMPLFVVVPLTAAKGAQPKRGHVSGLDRVASSLYRGPDRLAMRRREGLERKRLA